MIAMRFMTLDNGIALEQMEEAIRRAVKDIQERPQLDGAREITFKIKIVPEFNEDPRDARRKVLSDLDISYSPELKLPRVMRTCSAYVDGAEILVKEAGPAATVAQHRQGDVEDYVKEQDRLVQEALDEGEEAEEEEEDGKPGNVVGLKR